MSQKIVIIGAGMAGISLAATLSGDADVTVIERESSPGYHATGRSAAVFAPAYGNAVIRALTAASRDFLEHPPAGFSDVPLLDPRSVIFFGRKDQQQALDHLINETADQKIGLAYISHEEAIRQIPCFRPDYLGAAVEDTSTSGIDVDALLQGFIRQLRANGGDILTGFEVISLEPAGTGWKILSSDGTSLTADIIVNAAGAWADQLAEMAGRHPLGLTPLRRTAITVDPPAGTEVSHWAMAIDADEELYFKPEAGRILVSPADETPSEPCDAQPEEIDVAIGVDRLEKATNLKVSRITHKWAGLRTFSHDKTPVVGFDPTHAGFFWLAGQGGYGIQTAPAMAELAASLLTGKGVPDRLAAYGVTEAALSPNRFAGNKQDQT